MHLSILILLLCCHSVFACNSFTTCHATTRIFLNGDDGSYSTDWSPGNYKATCDNNYRVVALSQRPYFNYLAHLRTAICGRGYETHPVLPHHYLYDVQELTNVVTFTSTNTNYNSRSTGDWHPTFVKTECTSGKFINGISHDPTTRAIKAITCANGYGSYYQNQACEALELQNNPGSAEWGLPQEWDPGFWRVNCAGNATHNMAMVGVSVDSNGWARKVLCCTK